jgi:hypothetical protein
MEFGVLRDGFSVLIQMAASLSEDLIEIVDGVEVLVGERLIDERPQVLGGLEFGAVGRLVDQPDAIGDGEIFWPVPAGIVELENDDALAPSAGLAGEELEQLREEGFVDAVRQVPDGLAARRGDEGGDVKPIVAMMAERDGPLADRRPYPAVDRLQAEPVLVRRPNFDRFVRMPDGFFRERVAEVFLKASAASAVADFGFFGRGDWIDQPIACSASQPRCGTTRASPSRRAIQAATLPLVHKPPSGGGDASRAFKCSSKSGLSTERRAPLLRRRSPSARGPNAL